MKFTYKVFCDNASNSGVFTPELEVALAALVDSDGDLDFIPDEHPACEFVRERAETWMEEGDWGEPVHEESCFWRIELDGEIVADGCETFEVGQDYDHAR